MFISKKTKLAVKIVEILEKEKIKKGPEIIKELEVSAPYFEQVTRELVTAGIVETIRGCRGGYYLKRDCSLYEIFAIFDNYKNDEKIWYELEEIITSEMKKKNFQRGK